MRCVGVLVTLLMLFAVSIGSIAVAGPGKWDDRAIPVDGDNGVYCTLDATTIRSTICLQDTVFVDVWVKYKLDEKAWQRIEMMADGELSVDEFKNIRNISVRYLFRLGSAASDKPQLKFELEKRYERADGQVIHTDGFRIPDEKSKWYSLDTMEQKVVLRLLTEPNFYHPSLMDTRLHEYMLRLGYNEKISQDPSEEESDNSLFIGDCANKEGFLGLPWGTALEDSKSITSTGSLNLGDYQIVYTYDGMGDFRYTVPSRTPVLLVFTKEQGLVMVNWQFEAMRPSLVEAALRNSLGEPINRGGTLTWKVSDNTRAILDGYRNGYVEGLTISSEAFRQKDKTLSRYL